MPASTERSTRERLLVATFAVLARNGRRRLQLSDVASEAGVSRPTLYRYFASKEDLLDAFARYQMDQFESGVLAAIAGLQGPERLDAALRYVVDFQLAYPLNAIVDVEPEHVVEQMRWLLPVLERRMQRLIPGKRADVAAAVVVRVVVSHFMLGTSEPQRYLTELRHAAGLSPRRGSEPLRMVSSA